MKRFLTILLISMILVSKWAYAQDDDFVRVPKQEMTQLIETIDRQLKRDSIQVLRIENFKQQILQYKQIQKSDSLLLMYGGQRINLYQEEINLYNKRVNYLEKSNNHWTKKPVLWFVLGAATIYVASEVVSNIQ